MDKNKLMEQLRKAVREVIQEELRHGKSSYDAKSGISSTELKNQEGDVVGYIKHTKKDGKLVAGGRIGPKAAKAVTAEEKITTNIPVAALPSYKKGEQPTVINPKTGEEEIKSDVSSWAKPLTAFQRRFKHLKPGETASLKGDPQDVKEAEYNQDAVDKAIKTSKPKIGKKEANAIHRLLKGRHGKKSKESMEDKARAMGQMDMFTLEEWIGMMEEAGYSLQENDPYRDRNPNPAPEPGQIPQGDGGMIGYRGIPRGPAPKPDPYRDRNPNPAPEPGQIPQGAGGYHIEERRRINKLSSKKK